MGSSVDLLKSWWRDTGNHHWLAHVLASHSVLRWQRWTVGAGGILLAVIGITTALSAAGPTDTFGLTIFGIVITGALLWALRWWFLPWPSTAESLALFAAADIAITACCLQDSDRVYGSLGAILLVVTGCYLTFFHGPKVLAAHAVWSLLSVTVLTWRMVSAGGDAYLAVAIVLIMVAAVVLSLPSLQFMFWLVQSESISDPLTKLLNRRGLEFQLNRLFEAKDEAEICVMIADLDQFKTVNDRFGHSMGDEVLIRTAQLLQVCDTADLVTARSGGEEFTVVGNLSTEQARAAAESFRQAVAADHIIPVTVSIGIAVFDPADCDGTPWPTPEELVQCADGAMYQAKTSGGDRVVVGELISRASAEPA
ncbi:GGDEF domain-containing protein [Nocardia sp. NBC_01503]|uniref:GGDEF domain-containing protein n=1 Tax=Nocardia sp. NBC_01503 TaxID=2975997 RepID=UPI002E7B242E|nr:GGDEF domain-containing protein [Nocardia sp. NBC_01503]WTL35515.1 GGDEF domain-containing protein [Nocardia sp. NBC_01503]